MDGNGNQRRRVRRWFGAAFALAIVLCFATSPPAVADSHHVSLSKIFPKGKCSPMAPNFELLVAAFAGGEITAFKIPDGKGGVIETITTFVNKQRDQWVIVGSKTESKVIFCLYASGVGKDTVENRPL